MKKERVTKWRLRSCAKFLASEKAAVNEYPYELRCYIDQGYRLKDGWGNVFEYECIDDGKDYVLFSVGSDGIPYTDDDICPKKYDSTYN
ncbi:type II secretion system protein GspG [Kordia sp.]|uniref:type II secretion system protein GspG n=1 Tax=Kordia sp. TaxID=1965332 RepID=UPI003D6BB742